MSDPLKDTGEALGLALVIVVGILMVITAIIQLGLMIVRYGMLVLLVGVLPLTAVGDEHRDGHDVVQAGRRPGWPGSSSTNRWRR